MKKARFFQSLFVFTLRRTHLLVFLNGFVLAVILYFYVEDNYESKLFGALAENVKLAVQNDTAHIADREEAVLIKSLQLVYNLEKSRALIFSNHVVDSWKSNFIQPLSFDLMTGQRACGGFSMVLARLLKELNVEVRIPQMQVGNTSGGHILVEAKTKNGWVVLDPSFNLSFRKPDGKLASFQFVHNNWASFTHTLPSDYNRDYKYEGVRYTNWEKIPIIMPAMKTCVAFAIGKEETAVFSLRSVLLEKFSVLLRFTLALYLALLISTVRYIFRRNMRMHALDPIHLFPKTRLTAKAV
ncbi:MAG: transglutaminase domain-containing protein [Chitinophagaceae bacterium]|nr:transglutaminase domain-containing protein [Chitinophagaceae bacterium]